MKMFFTDIYIYMITIKIFTNYKKVYAILIKKIFSSCQGTYQKKTLFAV